MHNFECLTTKAWVKDQGYAQALTANPGVRMFRDQVLGPGRPDIAAYLRKEKKDKTLQELLLYMGMHIVPQTLTYFSLPADTVPFLQWVYNHVSHEEREQIKNYRGQMNHFPYPQLYEIWQGESDDDRTARANNVGNVLVYFDRITENDGAELILL